MNKELFKQVASPVDASAQDLERFNCYRYCGRVYGGDCYEILSEPHPQTTEEWIEAVGGTNNFGGRRSGNTITVYIDQAPPHA